MSRVVARDRMSHREAILLSTVRSVSGGLCRSKVAISERGRELAALFADSLWGVFESALVVTPRKL